MRGSPLTTRQSGSGYSWVPSDAGGPYRAARPVATALGVPAHNYRNGALHQHAVLEPPCGLGFVGK